MAEDFKTTLYNAHLDSRNKYVYFLLAAAGACIGFAANQTQGSSLSWTQIPLGLAVLCWGISFSFGCLHLQQVAGILYDNMELLEVRSGSHPLAGRDATFIDYASTMLRESMARTSKRSARLYRWQFYMIIIGGVMYISWHITSMYLRTR